MKGYPNYLCLTKTHNGLYRTTRLGEPSRAFKLYLTDILQCRSWRGKGLRQQCKNKGCVSMFQRATLQSYSKTSTIPILSTTLNIVWQAYSLSTTALDRKKKPRPENKYKHYACLQMTASEYLLAHNDFNFTIALRPILGRDVNCSL